MGKGSFAPILKRHLIKCSAKAAQVDSHPERIIVSWAYQYPTSYADNIYKLTRQVTATTTL